MIGGIGKLFVYGRRPEMRPFVIEDLNMVPNLINLKVPLIAWERLLTLMVLHWAKNHEHMTKSLVCFNQLADSLLVMRYIRRTKFLFKMN